VDRLAAVVLAAGRGTRLRPLTLFLPKALCPVHNRPLLDLALERVSSVTSSAAVNAHHHRGRVESHVAGRAHVSVEERRPLGTAGAIGRLRGWIDGRDVLVHNVDAWHGAGLELDRVVAGWDRERTRLLVVDDEARGDFGRWRYAGIGLLPWAVVRDLPDGPAGLYEVSWARLAAEDRLDLVASAAPFVACDSPAEYLEANLAASGGVPVVARDAVVEGQVSRAVVWPGGRVPADEHLADAIRIGTSVTVTPPPPARTLSSDG
jgi:N-acetyl-alpha-D-muramate 1-phosphate uridylyltransferase